MEAAEFTLIYYRYVIGFAFTFIMAKISLNKNLKNQKWVFELPQYF